MTGPAIGVLLPRDLPPDHLVRFSQARRRAGIRRALGRRGSRLRRWGRAGRDGAGEHHDPHGLNRDPAGRCTQRRVRSHGADHDGAALSRAGSGRGSGTACRRGCAGGSWPSKPITFSRSAASVPSARCCGGSGWGDGPVRAAGWRAAGSSGPPGAPGARRCARAEVARRRRGSGRRGDPRRGPRHRSMWRRLSSTWAGRTCRSSRSLSRPSTTTRARLSRGSGRRSR